MSGQPHYTPRATQAERAMSAAELRLDEKLARLLDRRREMLTALKEYAQAADLALLGDFGSDTRDQMAAVYVEARDARRRA